MERKLRELASLFDRIATDVTFMVNEGKEENVAGMNVELWNYDEVVAGYVELAGKYFFSPELVKLHGEIVEVRGYECDDIANVFDIKGNFICKVEGEEIPEKIRAEKERRKNQLPHELLKILYPRGSGVQLRAKELSPEEKRKMQKEFESYERARKSVQALYGKHTTEHKYKNGGEGRTSLPSPDSSSKREDGKKCKSSIPESLHISRDAFVSFVQSLEGNSKNRKLFLSYLLKPLIQLYLGVLPLPEAFDRLNRFCQKVSSTPCGNYSKESLSSNSDFSAEGTSIADISRSISPSPTSSEAGSPPPASLFKQENPDDKEV